ncbi:MAG: hypothetical protein AAGA85_18295 [Bacteroidota bacterium]
MTRATKIIITLGVSFTLFCALLLLSFQPVPLPNADNTVLVQGLISSVEADEQTKDLVFAIEGSGDTYYVNRGMEMIGFDASDLDQLVGKQVSLQYVRTTSPLEFIAGTHHISKIELEGFVAFDELEDLSAIDLAAN